MSERGARGFWIAFVPLAAAAVAPLWLGEFPPLSDLPQHAAQVSALRQWTNPACGYPGLYEIRWSDPYWLGYALAWGLSWLVAVPVALRLVLSLVVVATALAARRAVRALGGDPCWALLCLPLAYGFPLSAGFYPYVVAVPLVLLLLPTGLHYARAPALRIGLALGAGCAALFFVHVLALTLAGLLLAALIVVAAPSWRALPRRLAPLLAALPAPLAWLLLAPAHDRAQRDFPFYDWTADRVLDLPVLLTGIPGRGRAAAALALALAALAWTRPVPAREAARWVPFGVVALLVVAGPLAYYIAPRHAVFLLPTLLLALDRAPEPRRPARALAVVAATAVLLGVVIFRFAAMAAEGRGLTEVLAAAPAGSRLLYFPLDHQSRYAADPPFLHSGMLHTVDRCGVAERSFARDFERPVRFRPGLAAPLPAHFEYMPYRFRWERDAGESYDLFLVRARTEPNVEKIAGAPGRLAPLAHAGRWWLYANAARGAAPAPVP